MTTFLDRVLFRPTPPVLMLDRNQILPVPVDENEICPVFLSPLKESYIVGTVGCEASKKHLHIHSAEALARLLTGEMKSRRCTVERENIDPSRVRYYFKIGEPEDGVINRQPQKIIKYALIVEGRELRPFFASKIVRAVAIPFNVLHWTIHKITKPVVIILSGLTKCAICISKFVLYTAAVIIFVVSSLILSPLSAWLLKKYPNVRLPNPPPIAGNNIVPPIPVEAIEYNGAAPLAIPVNDAPPPPIEGNGNPLPPDPVQAVQPPNNAPPAQAPIHNAQPAQANNAEDRLIAATDNLLAAMDVFHRNFNPVCLVPGGIVTALIVGLPILVVLLIEKITSVTFKVLLTPPKLTPREFWNYNGAEPVNLILEMELKRFQEHFGAPKKDAEIESKEKKEKIDYHV